MISSFITINDLSSEIIYRIVEDSLFLKNQSKIPNLKDKTAVMIFAEPSTRTKLSFELAMNKLGIKVIDFNWGQSSVSKGETLEETLLTIDAMGIDYVVVRTAIDDFPKRIEKLAFKNLKIINAGSGTTHHPSQAMLDLVTIKESIGNKPISLGIIGDTKHSRVYSSWRELCEKIDLPLLTFGPDSTIKKEELFKNCNFLMLLRWQKERHRVVQKNLSSVEKYSLKKKDIPFLKAQTKILHPGPHVLGEEIDEAVLNHQDCLVRSQVENGVYARMSIVRAISGVLQ